MNTMIKFAVRFAKEFFKGLNTNGMNLMNNPYAI